MLTRCKLIGLLTPRQLELLKSLYELRTQMGAASLWRPKDLGAYRHSHHAKTLSSLEQQGLVEREPCSETVRTQYGYRITTKGHDTFEQFRSFLDIPLESLLGSQADRTRARYALQLAA